MRMWASHWKHVYGGAFHRQGSHLYSSGRTRTHYRLGKAHMCGYPASRTSLGEQVRGESGVYPRNMQARPRHREGRREPKRACHVLLSTINLLLDEQRHTASLSKRRMQNFKLSFALFVGAGITFVACGSQDADDNATAGSSSSSSGSDVTHCGIFTNTGYNTCDACIHQACCPEVTACGGMDACLSCALYHGDWSNPVCAPLKELGEALGTCSYNHCYSACWAGGPGGSSESRSSSSGSGS